MQDLKQYRYIDVDKLDEDWNHGSTLTIQSSFILRAVSKAPARKDHSDTGINSPPCGFGWYIRFLYCNAQLGTEAGINVFLNPSFLQSANVGQIGVQTRIYCSQVKKPSLPLSTVQAATFSSADYNLLAQGQWKPWGNPDTPVPITAEYHIDIALTFAESVASKFPRLMPIIGDRRPELEEVMNDSLLSGGDVVDLKFSLYAARQGDTLVKPTTLFGTTKLLRGHCDYLDTLIDGDDFKADGPLPATSVVDDVCDCDSDFEDADDPVRLASSSTEGKTQAFDEKDPEEKLGHDRVIPVKSAAHQTWKVLLHYLYTGKVSFRHISSHPSSRKQTKLGGSQTMTCSPKSMYRLADELDLPELKARAFQAIKDDISTDNIAVELYSKFTSMYEEVRGFELDFATSHDFRDIAGIHELSQRVFEGVSAHERHVSLDIIRRAFAAKK